MGTGLFDPIPTLANQGDSFGEEVTWPHRLLEKQAAHDRGINGSGIVVALGDLGCATQYQWRLPTLQSRGFGTSFGGFLTGLTPVAITGTLKLLVDSATSVDAVFAGEATIAAQAAVINAALGSNGFAATQWDEELALVYLLGLGALKYIIIGSNDTTSSGKIEIVAGSTQSVLDGLGMETGKTGEPGDMCGGGEPLRTPLFKFVKPVFDDNPAFKQGTNVTPLDFANSTGTTSIIDREVPTAFLGFGPFNPIVFRNEGATGAAAARTFTIDTGGASSFKRLAFTGLQPGDLLFITAGPEASAAPYVVQTVIYINGDDTNEANQFTVDRDWPAGSTAGITFFIVPADSRTAKMDWSLATYQASMIAGQRGLGMAPGATLIFHHTGPTVAGMLASMQNALAAGCDVYQTLTPGLDGISNNTAALAMVSLGVEQLAAAGINVMTSVIAAPPGFGTQDWDTILNFGFFQLPASVDSVIGVSQVGPKGNVFSETTPAGVNLADWANQGFGHSVVDVASPASNLEPSKPVKEQWANTSTGIGSCRGGGVTKEDAIAANWPELGLTRGFFSFVGAAHATGVMALCRHAIRTTKSLKNRVAEASIAAAILRHGAQDQVGSPGLDKAGADPHYKHGVISARRSVNKGLKIKE